MNDAERPDVVPVTHEPAAPLPPRWVRRLVIGGAVSVALVASVPAMLALLFRRRKPGGSPDVDARADVSVACTVSEEGDQSPPSR